MASLFKKSTGWYYAAFCDSTRKPKIKQVALKTKNKRDAEKQKLELETEYDKGRYDPWDNRPTQRTLDLGQLESAKEAFIQSRMNLSPYTVTKYQSVLGLLVDYLGSTYPTAKITTEHVQGFLDSPTIDPKTEKPVFKKPITKKTYTSTVSPFFNWLLEQEAIRENPTNKLRLERVPQKYARYLTPKDVDEICKAIRESQANKHTNEGTCEWLISIVRANVYLGLRAGELVNLKWEHVDLERRTLRVANTETFRTKSGKERTLPLCEPVLEIFRGLERTCEYVFPNYGGTKLHRQYLSRMFKHFAVKAGLERLNWHATRHTAASWLAMSACGVEAIRLYMGHSSITVSQRYMHLSPDVHSSQINGAFARIG